MYVYCMVCYRVIAAPYVRSVGHVFAYLYTLDDDSERPMDYETSLLPNIFPLQPVKLFISMENVFQTPFIVNTNSDSSSYVKSPAI